MKSHNIYITRSVTTFFTRHTTLYIIHYISPHYRHRNSYRYIYCMITSVCQHVLPESTFVLTLVCVLWSFVVGRLRGACCGPPTAFPVGYRCPVMGCCCWIRDIMCSLRSRSACVWGCDNNWLQLMCNWEYLHPCSTGSPVQALSRHHSQSFVSFPPNYLRVVGALQLFSLFEISRNFLACCLHCRNPSCSRKCKSVSFSED